LPVSRTTLPSATGSSSGDLVLGAKPSAAETGLHGFINWLLSLPGVTAFAVEPESARVHASSSLSRFVQPPADSATLAGLVGCDRLDAETVKRAAIYCGPRQGEDPRQLWAVIPVEADSGDLLIAGLHVGLAEGDSPAAQEAGFQAALQEPDRRHGINQPLTALSFLLENLLHAFQTSTPDAGYRGRKTGDLALQIRHLRELLRVADSGDER
jgi:hypothetical protein